MLPYHLNIDLEQDIDSKVQILYTDDLTNLPVNITGFSAYLTVSYRVGEAWVLLKLVDVLNPAYVAGTSGISLGGVSGVIQVDFAAADTKGWPWVQAVYDLVLVDLSGVRTKISSGFININGSVTL